MPLCRHGDLLVERVEKMPSEVRPLPHLVLAEGELTGHSHRIAEKGAAKLFRSWQEMFLVVVEDSATLIHQEHGPIQLPTGKAGAVIVRGSGKPDRAVPSERRRRVQTGRTLAGGWRI